MAIADSVLNSLQSEKIKLLKLIDSGKGDQEDNKRQLKNVSEKIRYRQNKLTAGTIVPETPKKVEPKNRSNNLRKNVVDLYNSGVRDAEAIAKKLCAKKQSVAWYMCKYRLK